jgi:hypothetical protein
MNKSLLKKKKKNTKKKEFDEEDFENDSEDAKFNKVQDEYE